jgi:CheY-like chemotaxis protein
LPGLPGCKEALDFFYEVPEPPICIFIDLSMPKVDGIDCIKLIRSDGILRYVPIFIISAKAF